MTEESNNGEQKNRGDDGRFLPGNEGGPGSKPGVPKGSAAKAIMQMVMEEIEENGVPAGIDYCRRIKQLAKRGGRGDAGYATAVNKLWDDSAKKFEISSNVQVPRRVSDCNIDEILGVDVSGVKPDTNGNGHVNGNSTNGKH